MKAGIFAAGDGTRLQGAFPGIPKPMVPVGGKPLVHWTVAALRSAGARSLVVLLNRRGRPARGYLKASFPGVAWTFVEADTRSSWESFRLVCRTLAAQAPRFVVSAVDALVPAPEVARFARAWQEDASASLSAGAAAEAALALTRFVDDEKPLWAELGPESRVAALGPAARRREFVTCGLYAATRELAESLPAPEAYGSLRDFWAGAVAGGRRILGVPLSKTLDVDRPEDLAAAEDFLAALGVAP